MGAITRTILVGLTLCVAGSAVAAPPAAATIDPPPSRFSSGNEAPPPPVEFQAIVEAARASRHPFFGMQQLADLSAKLTEPDLGSGQRVEILTELSGEQLRLGQVEAAIATADQALSLAAQARSNPIRVSMARMARALAYLRLAEQQNCVDLHCQDSCLFPIRGGGVHQAKAAAEQAWHDLLDYLREGGTERQQAQWLLNVVAMTLGRYPAEVPAEHLLMPELFESAIDIGRFVDIAPLVGLNRMGLAGGVAVADFDRDGLLDLAASDMDVAGPLALFRNSGTGPFEDLAPGAGLDTQWGGLQVQAVDYNNDGWMDLCLPRGGWQLFFSPARLSLLENRGDGSFADVTHQAGLAEPAFPRQTSVWLDYDNDGDLDVYLGNESLAELGQVLTDVYRGGDYPCQLMRNNGDGTFTDVAPQAGVTNDRFTKGAAAGDYDNDGDPDLYVANRYSDDPRNGFNRLYRNNGDGTFTDVAQEMGVVDPPRAFACWFWDYDNDGWLDLWVGSFDNDSSEVMLGELIADYRGAAPNRARTGRLYRNLAGRTFQDVTVETGLDHPWMVMGATFGDANGDGFLDMYLGTGTPEYAVIVPNQLLINDQGKRFLNATTSAGVGHLQKGHGVAFADFDNDGDQDLYADLGGAFTGDFFSNSLFVNPGHGNAYLYLELTGVQSNRQAVGARVRVRVDAGNGIRDLHRAVGSTSSFGSTPPRLEVSLGQAQRIVEVEVVWPRSGIRSLYREPPLNSCLAIEEGAPHWKVVPLRKVRFPVPVPASTSGHQHGHLADAAERPRDSVAADGPGTGRPAASDPVTEHPSGHAAAAPPASTSPLPNERRSTVVVTPPSVGPATAPASAAVSPPAETPAVEDTAVEDTAAREAIDRFTDLEQTSLTLTHQLKSLASDLMNLGLPLASRDKEFAPEVELVDLAPDAPRHQSKNLPQIGTRVFDWLLAAPRTEAGPRWQLWQPLLAEVDYFDFAKFSLVRNDFLGPDRDRMTTDVAFEGLAKTRSMLWQWIKANLVLEWRNFQPDDPADPQWRITAFRTRDLHTYESPRRLFDEASGRLVSDAVTRARLKTSIKERQIVQALTTKDFVPPNPYWEWHTFDRHPSVAVVDVNRDGFDDLYVTDEFGANVLLVHQADGTFRDEASDYGLAFDGGTNAALFADFDNDGDADLLLGRSLEPSLYLVREGDRFVDRTEALVGGPLPALVSSIAAADVNGDGLLDAYLSTYAASILNRQRDERPAGSAMLDEFLPPHAAARLGRLVHESYDEFQDRPGPPNWLLLGAGEGRLRPAADSEAVEVWRNTYQTVLADYDSDGDSDLYVVNDFGPNNLFQNDGTGGFRDVTAETDTADIGFGMGASFGDYDRDGDQDLYISNMFSKAGQRITTNLAPLVNPNLRKMAGGNSLLRNSAGRFTKVSGLEPPALLVEKSGWSWGGQFLDVDNDGYLDLFATSGYYSAPAEVSIELDL